MCYCEYGVTYFQRAGYKCRKSERLRCIFSFEIFYLSANQKCVVVNRIGHVILQWYKFY